MEPVFTAPITLDLGQTKGKSLRKLSEGRGRLWGDVQDAINEVTRLLGEQAQGKQLVPVVVVYRRKIRRKDGGLL